MWKRGFVLLALMAPCLVSTANAETYILNAAGMWGSGQTAAVAAAGGTVTFSERDSGVGVATASAADFLELALASPAFTSGALDVVGEWELPFGEASHAPPVPGDDGPIDFLQWHLEAVEARAAWAAGCTGDGVRIAVVDGAMPASHADIAPNLDVDASRSFVPGDFDEGDPSTPFRHAGFVAGVAAAADNGIGVIGIAHQATIIGVKVTGTGSFSPIIQGIEYASRPLVDGGAGADIINLSIAGFCPKTLTGFCQPILTALHRVVNTAARRGVLVISAAGNNGLNFDQAPLTIVPAESGNGIAISATGPVGWALGATNFRRPASYTNHGHSLVHVSAPGGDFVLPNGDMCTVGGITRLCWVLDNMFGVIGTDPDDDSSVWGWGGVGTSYSAPAAVGVAALIKERFPNISVGAWKNKLANTADDEGAPGNDIFHGRGFVNARRACTE